MQVKCFGCPMLLHADDVEGAVESFVAHGKEQHTWPYPEEAIRTYANYFGPFYVHDVDGYVVHDQVGTLNVGRNGPPPLARKPLARRGIS